ncbi:MAG: hypothetical protein KDJ36_11105 [Hyphomicrobiaceae bacterium]|nr:hypothetical protein [Hyphomicrobiaceae bacterium]
MARGDGPGQRPTAAGQTTSIAIVIDTGPAEVTPAEWTAIVLAAAAARQPLWAASFTLQAKDPIPADYAGDGTGTVLSRSRKASGRSGLLRP